MCVNLMLRKVLESALTRIPVKHTQDLVESVSGCFICSSSGCCLLRANWLGGLWDVCTDLFMKMISKNFTDIVCGNYKMMYVLRFLLKLPLSYHNNYLKMC